MDNMSGNTNQMDDHDILIELKTNFARFTDQYQKDISELKSGTAGKLVDHENRIDALEKIQDEIKPVQTVKEFRVLQQAFRDQQIANRTTVRLIGIFSPIISSIITMVLFQVLRTLHWLE